MKQKLLAVLITLAMLAGTYGMTPFILELYDNGAPIASRGMLDLTHWDFAEDGVAKLDGEWEFYPNQLLDAEHFASDAPPVPEWILVPGSWVHEMDALGSATYRLRVNIGDQNQVYGLKTLSIQMSSRILVNGEAVGESGNPAPDKERYQAKNEPFDSYFPLKPGLNEIIVQVANFDYAPSSGINHSILLGLPQQMMAIHDKALAHDWITFISFLVMGIYFIGLYTQRRKDYFLLIFGLLCFSMAIYSSMRGEKISYDLFPDMPIWLFLRIQFLSTVGAGAGLLLYLYSAFRDYCSKRVILIGLMVGGLLAFLIAGFFVPAYSRLILPVTTIYATFPFIYAVYVFVLAALDQVEGSLYLLLAAIALNVFAFLQNLNVYVGVPLYLFPPFEPILFLLMLALLMSLRFSNAFKEIETLTTRLIRADQLKDEFLTRTAHEFKTPLHGIINIAQSMMEDTRHPVAPGQQDNLSLISTTAKRLSQLVYDILDFAKLKQGELAVHPVPLDVRANVDVILKIFSFMVDEKRVRLVNDVPEDLSYVLADEMRFRQVVSNLLDNAIKYTEQGSIEVSAAEKDGRIEVSIKDTGSGIHESDLPTIFEPFESRGVDSDQSFGLGLPIVKQLVELQNGSIRVTSKPGWGTIFTFSLPAARRDGSAQTGKSGVRATPDYSFPTPYISERKGTHTILAVDDNFANLKVLIDLLEQLDYTVIAVKHGYEALQQIESRHSIDMVILDLMMPGLSGLEVCRAIRRNYSLLEMPVIMVTASIQTEDKIAAFDSGANDFLSKPLDAAELRARVKSLLVMKESVGKAVDMEVAFLQSQIKPHFLFNVLNTIMALSYTDVERSRKLTTDLADYLRGSFQFSNIQETVPFSSELALIHSYAEIEKARFKDRIRLEYNIEDAVHTIKLPPLLVQPLVENAIRHGIGNRLEGGTVRIRAYQTQDGYRIEVEDDGAGMTQERLQEVLAMDPLIHSDSQSGVGLKNINQRLKYVYGTRLDIESVAGVGTKVTIRIPVESMQRS